MPAEMALEKMAFNSKVLLSSSIQGLFGAIQVINSFPGERVLVLRERAAGTYCTSAYFLSKSVAELLFQTPQPIIFSTVVYWLVGFQAEGVCYHARLGTKCAYCYILCISKLKVSADSTRHSFVQSTQSGTRRVARTRAQVYAHLSDKSSPLAAPLLVVSVLLCKCFTVGVLCQMQRQTVPVLARLHNKCQNGQVACI